MRVVLLSSGGWQLSLLPVTLPNPAQFSLAAFSMGFFLSQFLSFQNADTTIDGSWGACKFFAFLYGLTKHQMVSLKDKQSSELRLADGKIYTLLLVLESMILVSTKL